MNQVRREPRPFVVIVGAARSGTKMLRSIVASNPETVSFPREINYIWRHGNRDFPTDELTPEFARPEVVRYIRSRFERFAAGRPGARIIEKTCANSLRVRFVHAVFPEAKIVNLVRDGRAVAESALRRWSTPNPVRYLIEKARWVPISDVPYYAWKYAGYRLGAVRGSGAYSSFGPRFAGLDDLVRDLSLIEVCGLQWRACVRSADEGLKALPGDQTITIRYEDLIADPLEVSRDLFDSLGLRLHTDSRRHIESEVHSGNLEKWRQRVSPADLDLLMPHIEDELRRQGYSV
jgi:hypothetical protein